MPSDEQSSPAEPCTVASASCACALTGEHKIHVCACGGSWSGTPETEDFMVYQFPQRSIDPDGTVREYSDARKEIQESLRQFLVGMTVPATTAAAEEEERKNE